MEESLFPNGCRQCRFLGIYVFDSEIIVSGDQVNMADMYICSAHSDSSIAVLRHGSDRAPLAGSEIFANASLQGLDWDSRNIKGRLLDEASEAAIKAALEEICTRAFENLCPGQVMFIRKEVG